MSVNKVAARKANLTLAYLTCKDVFPGISFDIFCRMFLFWEVKPILRYDKYIGVVLQKDSEVHIGILPEFRKKSFGKWLGSLIQSCMINGAVTTVVPLGDRDKLRFAERLGWRILETTDGSIRLIMTMEDYNNVWNKVKT